MQYQAYVIGRLKRDALGAWVMVAVDIYSEAAWQLTNMGDSVLFVQLSQPYEGPSFENAMAQAKQDTERRYRGLKSLFSWRTR